MHRQAAKEYSHRYELMTDFPPGPRGGFLGIGLLGPIQRDFLKFAQQVFDEHGDIASYRLAGHRIFQFTHPQQYHEILVTHSRAFHKTKRLRQILGRWTGNGLLLNEGDDWARQRRLVQGAFQPHRLRSYADAIVRHTTEMFQPYAGHKVNVADVLHRLTFRTVAEALFGAEVDEIADDFLQAVATLQSESIGDFTSAWVRPLWWPTSSRKKLRGAMRFLDEVVRGFIAQRRTSGEDRGDLLSMLINAVDDEEGGGRMSDEQVRDESVGLLLGGNETTATALVWTFYLLAKNETFQEEAQGEIDHVTGGAPATGEHAERLAFTAATMKEAMRLYPPAYVLTRDAVEDVEIGGCLVPRGSQIHLPIALTQRDARWFDGQDSFLPHRFLSDGEKNFPRCAYLPFGAGPRACVGRGLAMLEGTLILAAVLQRFSLRLPEDHQEPVAQAQISLHPRDGLELTLERRA